MNELVQLLNYEYVAMYSYNDNHVDWVVLDTDPRNKDDWSTAKWHWSTGERFA